MADRRKGGAEHHSGWRGEFNLSRDKKRRRIDGKDKTMAPVVASARGEIRLQISARANPRRNAVDQQLDDKAKVAMDGIQDMADDLRQWSMERLACDVPALLSIAVTDAFILLQPSPERIDPAPMARP